MYATIDAQFVLIALKYQIHSGKFLVEKKNISSSIVVNDDLWYRFSRKVLRL